MTKTCSYFFLLVIPGTPYAFCSKLERVRAEYGIQDCGKVKQCKDRFRIGVPNSSYNSCQRGGESVASRMMQSFKLWGVSGSVSEYSVQREVYKFTAAFCLSDFLEQGLVQNDFKTHCCRAPGEHC